ncbi:MAG: hypothetical protein IPJ65_24985 [Archangiaceae bacterium]|nr:hypothetical protein [Archangiaceae bacterium]
MFTRGLACVLLLSGCFDLHLLDGRACSSDSDCGNARVCHRGVCTMGGSFVDVPVPLDQLSSEGGAALGLSVTRDPTRPSLTAFTAGPALPGPRTGSAAAQGLLLSGTGTAEVLGPFGPTTPLPSARSQHAATAAGGKLFVLGGLGADGTTLLAEVLSAPLSGDGGVGPWSTETPLPAARAGLTAFAAGGFVYAVGGEAATGLLDEVLAAPLSGAGALGAWKVVARLPEGRARAGGASFDGRLYLAGGSCSGTCAPLRAALLSDGGWARSRCCPRFPSARAPP